MRYFSRIYFRAALVAFVVALTAGCGGYSPEAHRVDAAAARETLEAVLTSWQQGSTPESWREKTPEVVVQDMQWKSGAKLQSFEIIDGGTAIDANLHCQVKLTLEDPQRGRTESTVTYLIGTSPVRTVFRAPGQ